MATRSLSIVLAKISDSDYQPNNSVSVQLKRFDGSTLVANASLSGQTGLYTASWESSTAAFYGNWYVNSAKDTSNPDFWMGDDQSLSAGSITSAGLIYSQSSGFKFPDGSLQTSAAVGITGVGVGTVNRIAKFASASSIGNSIMTDDGTNVGIGTTGNTTANTHLHVSSSGGGAGRTNIRVHYNYGGAANGDRVSNWLISATSNQGALELISAANKRVRFLDSGEVGINLLGNPLATLHVSGSVSATNLSANTVNVISLSATTISSASGNNFLNRTGGNTSIGTSVANHKLTVGGTTNLSGDVTIKNVLQSDAYQHLRFGGNLNPNHYAMSGNQVFINPNAGQVSNAPNITFLVNGGISAGSISCLGGTISVSTLSASTIQLLTSASISAVSIDDDTDEIAYGSSKLTSNHVFLGNVDISGAGTFNSGVFTGTLSGLSVSAGSVSAGIVKSSNYYSSDGSVGETKVVTFVDAGAQTNTITIKNGLIISWTQA